MCLVRGGGKEHSWLLRNVLDCLANTVAIAVLFVHEMQL